MAEPDKRIQALIAEDLVEADPSLTVVAQVRSGLQALEHLRDQVPDLLLMDLALPERSGLEIASEVRRAGISTGVVFYAALYSDTYVLEAFERGALGYVLKGQAESNLTDALHEAAAGQRVVCDQISCHGSEQYLRETRQKRRPLYETLTERERDVLYLTAQAFDIATIADRLHISDRTVEKHLEHLRAKLGLSSQLELMRYGFQQGFVPLPLSGS